MLINYIFFLPNKYKKIGIELINKTIINEVRFDNKNKPHNIFKLIKERTITSAESLVF